MSRAEPATVPEARERIVAAARKLFAEKGFAATAVHEITDLAEVNRALLYYYFEDKHSLYAAVMEEGHVAFMGMLDDALSRPGSYADRLAAFVRGHLDLIWCHGDLARIVHRCLLDGYQEEFGLPERFNAAVRRLEQFFAEGAAAGEFRPADPGLLTRTCIGTTFVFSLWRIYEGDRYSREAIGAEITALLLRGLVRG